HLTGHLRVGLRPPLSPLGSAQIQFAIIAPSVPALCVAEVNDCPCYPVCHLVRVAWVHFLKHDFVVLLLKVITSVILPLFSSHSPKKPFIFSFFAIIR
ncbi:MAG: hypothetical protein UHU21_01485, partial [Lachnospiraceae bacterium]|nr:hypothetical protein [Lachnospiraceae bacterium]